MTDERDENPEGRRALPYDGREDQLPMVGTHGQMALYDPARQDHLEEDAIDLQEILRVILKYRWMIALVVAIAVATALGTSLLKRPVYRATSLLEVKPPSGSMVRLQNVDTAGGTASWQLAEFHHTQRRILQSDSVSAAVIRELGLQDNPELTGEIRQRGVVRGLKQVIGMLTGGGESEARAAARRGSGAAQDADGKDAAERLAGSLRSRLTVEPIRDSFLFNVSFESFNPELAARVVNAISSEYIEQNNQRRFDSTTSAKKFLEKEIERVQARLETSEKELNDFARTHNLVDLEESDNIVSTRLRTLNNQLAEVRGQRITAESRYRRASQAQIDALPDFLENELISTLTSRYAELQTEYQRMAQTYKPAYPDMQQLQAEIQGVKANLDEAISRRVQSLQSEYEELASREQALQAAVEEQKDQLLALEDRAVQYNILKREVETNQELYTGLLERMKEVGVAAGLERTNISIIDEAGVPGAPYKPDITRNVSMAGAIGLMGGVGLAFLLAFLDNTVRTRDDLERLVNSPCLGMVPRIKRLPESRLAAARQLDLSAAEKPDSSISEAYRSIRTSLMFSRPDGPPKTILVTSSGPGEGKTTACVNLATVLAQNGSKVLLIDGDLRKPRLHKTFGVPGSPGLTEQTVENRVQQMHETGIDGVRLLPAGTVPPNPAELIGSAALQRFLKAAQTPYDHIIIDSPPVMGLADALIGSTIVDATLMVIGAGQISKQALREAYKRLFSVRAPVIGCVLNGVDMESSEYAYYTRYYYNYGDIEQESGRKGLAKIADLASFSQGNRGRKTG